MDDTEADWEKWRHPLDLDLPHPLVPSFPVPIDTSSKSPATVYMIERYKRETGNYSYFRKSLSYPDITFELQDLSSDHTFSLEELHDFCGKASGMYAIADLRETPVSMPRQKGLCGRLYGEWFKMVESDSSHETRFFARFMQTDGLDIADIVARHRALSQQLEKQMREPIKRVIEGETYPSNRERRYHGECTLLPTFKDLVIIVEEKSFRAPALLFVLDPRLAHGIKEMEGAEEDEVGGQKVLRLRAAMEDIMRAVVAMQKKLALMDDGITGCYIET
ncbi:hypothetical protein EIK77_002252 [Talaromyces pinophilus]|nr:hypothetical protein EIK77_002252 [Talaromyces pinophilus]PCG89635.1 Hypothetical protein PENO1_103530 [Penicillium occitanis (nom. inval.)]PCG89997.1 hypothetical protein PENOC_104140 [Penicillium occitanis (nom. inval.)]